jgi:hypothetical protein
VFYLGGNAQVWVGDSSKGKFVPSKGTAFTRGDTITMNV